MTSTGWTCSPTTRHRKRHRVHALQSRHQPAGRRHEHPGRGQVLERSHGVAQVQPPDVRSGGVVRVGIVERGRGIGDAQRDRERLAGAGRRRDAPLHAVGHGGTRQRLPDQQHAEESDETVVLTLTPGTAEAGDYGPLAGISVTAGQTLGTGSITTAEDADQDDETVTVALGERDT